MRRLTSERLTGCVPTARTVSVGTVRGMPYPSDLTDDQWDLLEPAFNAPGKRGRKRKIRHDKPCYRERWRIEATFNRLKDFRRIATRYDKLARNYVSAVALVAVIAFWC